MPLKDDVHRFIDTHIREIQYTVYGIGALGLYLVVRDLRLATTFRHVTDIPPKFITSHVTLQGRVMEVTESGSLQVCHEPVFTLPFSRWIHRFHQTAQESDMLTVELAGVELTTRATQWLSLHVADQHVWFTMLHATPQALLCSVSKKKNLLVSLNINKFLVQEGLAPVQVNHCAMLGDDTQAQKLLSQLLAAQRAAQKQHRGIWQEDKRQQRTPVWKRGLTWLVLRFRKAIGRDKKMDV